MQVYHFAVQDKTIKELLFDCGQDSWARVSRVPFIHKLAFHLAKRWQWGRKIINQHAIAEGSWLVREEYHHLHSYKSLKYPTSPFNPLASQYFHHITLLHTLHNVLSPAEQINSSEQPRYADTWDINGCSCQQLVHQHHTFLPFLLYLSTLFSSSYQVDFGGYSKILTSHLFFHSDYCVLLCLDTKSYLNLHE